MNTDKTCKVFERYAANLEMFYFKLFDLDKSINRDRLDILRTGHANFDKMVEDISKSHSGNGHIWLGFIAVDPMFQRKGVGTQLLQWGLERSDVENIPIGLVGSKMGCGLYEKVGFEDVGIFEVTGCHIEDRVMIRRPKTIEQLWSEGVPGP